MVYGHTAPNDAVEQVKNCEYGGKIYWIAVRYFFTAYFIIANLLNVADGTGKVPGMGMNHAPARRVGATLACPLTGHIGKGHAKGVLRNKIYIEPVNVTVCEDK